MLRLLQNCIRLRVGKGEGDGKAQRSTGGQSSAVSLQVVARRRPLKILGCWLQQAKACLGTLCTVHSAVTRTTTASMVQHSNQSSCMLWRLVEHEPLAGENVALTITKTTTRRCVRRAGH